MRLTKRANNSCQAWCNKHPCILLSSRRVMGYGDYVGEPTGYKRGMDAVEPLSDFEA
ncbi:hypothetical protein [Dysgonomonas sp.]|uniref:hypothetical protein n=1 Tax=Dysgonomonas sp. TaxID=1891233 RepID=UPI0027BA4D3D|nr:hypothetical protein [Dysgonomonas sp.]